MGWSIHKPEDWKPYQDEIYNLYYDERWELKKLSQHMRSKHGLKATDRQYKQLLKKSGRSKHLSAPTWVAVGSAMRDRALQGKDTEVVWDNEIVETQKVQREIKRYRQHKGPPKLPDASLHRLVLRTPPPTSSASMSTAQPRSTWTSPIVENQGYGDDSTRLFIPSDALSEHDYGSLQVLYREAVVHDLPVYGRSRINMFNAGTLSASEYLDNSNDLLARATSVSAFREGIPRSPDHSWTWESCRSMLAAEEFLQHRQRIPGFPPTDRDWINCSKTDVLNMVINLSVNCVNHQSGPPRLQLPIGSVTWFMDDRRRQLLELMFRPKLKRLVPFVRAFLAGMGQMQYGSAIRLSASRTVTHFIKCAFLCVEQSVQGRFSELEATGLLLDVARFDVPEVATTLIQKGADIHNRAGLRFRLHTGETSTALAQAVSFGRRRMVTVLLNAGADPKPAIVAAIHHDARLKGEHQEHDALLPLLVAHGADLALVGIETFPLTYAEYYSFKSASLARALAPSIQHTRSLETIKILTQWPRNLKTFSLAAQEVALIGAIKLDDLKVAKSLLRSGTDSNCPNLALSVSSEARYKSTPGLTLTPDCPSVEGPMGASNCHKLAHPICYAFENRNVAMARLLLETGVNLPRCLLPRLNLPYDSVNFLRKLTSSLFQPRLLHRTGHYLLALAAIDDNVDIITSLVGSGVPLNESWVSFGSEAASSLDTHLAFALQHSSLRVVTLLWGLGAVFAHQQHFAGAFELSVLLGAYGSAGDFDEKFRFLMSKGACVTVPCDVNGYNDKAASPLQSFIKTLKVPGKAQIDTRSLLLIETLVANGADVNSINSTSSTPLQLACAAGRFDIMKYLVYHRADVNLTRGEWPSPLASACGMSKFRHFGRPEDQKKRSGNSVNPSEAVKFLIQSGADVNLEVEGHLTALTMAFLHGRLDTVRLLIGHGADVSMRSPPGSDGRTILQHVCCNSNDQRFNVDWVETARFLIENEADINAQAIDHTALQWASQHGHFALVLLLLESGADVNAPCGPLGKGTAVEVAAQAGYFDVVKLLANAGAEKDVAVGRLSRAFSLASSAGHFHVSGLLESLS